VSTILELQGAKIIFFRWLWLEISKCGTIFVVSQDFQCTGTHFINITDLLTDNWTVNVIHSR
jgi:hypothetical protein